MTTNIGSSTSFAAIVPDLTDTADIQVALRLLSYGLSSDPADNAAIATNSVFGKIRDLTTTKANVASPVFTGTVYAPTIQSASSATTSLNLSTINQSSSSAGSISITAGNSTSNGSGGSINLTAGSYSASGAAGNININAGGGTSSGSINIGTSMGSSQPINIGNSGSAVAIPGTLSNAKIANSGLFSFFGGSTSTGLTTLTNVPGTISFATSVPSMLISVLTGNATTSVGNVGAEFRASSSTTTHLITFSSGSTARGSISLNASTVTYGTGSDYRLKENIKPISNALDRLSLLKPSRFNFIESPEKTVDGFIAHEAQQVVPESVTGSKDEINKDGSPAYQSIDQSKLVPLLTAALQEAILKIESLETRVKQLEN
jgi:hypothetical protein